MAQAWALSARVTPSLSLVLSPDIFFGLCLDWPVIGVEVEPSDSELPFAMIRTRNHRDILSISRRRYDEAEGVVCYLDESSNLIEL